MRSTVIFLCFCLITLHARADWVVLGGAVQCDPKNKIFTVVPTVETSSSEYNITAPPGFTTLPQGENQEHKCNLDDANIDMVINIYGPQAQGMGQGAGVIIIDNLAIGDHHLIANPTNFNWQVIDERVLTEIRIEKQESQYKAELCYSNGWDWDTPYQKKLCETTLIQAKN